MNLIRRAFVSLAIVTLAAPCVAADPVLVFVLAGQSNMVGYGANASPDLSPQASVLYDFCNPDVRPPKSDASYADTTTSTTWDQLTTEGTSSYYGPELSFAKAIREALPGRQIAIVKFAQKGTNIFQHWARNALDDTSQPPRGLAPDADIVYKSQLYHALMGKLDSAKYDAQPPVGQPVPEGSNALAYPDEPGRLDTALDRLTNDGLTYEIGAVLWMQGENEAGSDRSSLYRQDLEAFIAAMRQDLKLASLPFIIGRVSDNLSADENGPLAPEDEPLLETVRAAQQAIADADANVEIIDTDDLPARPKDGDGFFDPYHFDSPGYVTMGERFAKSYLALKATGGAGGQGGAGGMGGMGGAPPAGGMGGAAPIPMMGAPGAATTIPVVSYGDSDGCTFQASKRSAPTGFIALGLVALAGLGRRVAARRKVG